MNVIEDVLTELSHGHVPNIFKEMGLKAELQYNRKSLVKKAAVVGVGLIAVGALLQASRKSRMVQARRRPQLSSPSL